MIGCIIFHKGYEIYQLDISKIVEEILVDAVLNCKDIFFQSFKCYYVCDVEFEVFKKGKKLMKKFDVLVKEKKQ